MRCTECGSISMIPGWLGWTCLVCGLARQDGPDIEFGPNDTDKEHDDE